MKNLQYKVCIFCAETVAIASERKCAADTFYVETNVWMLLKTFQCFFKERASASEKILRKNVRLFLKRP